MTSQNIVISSNFTIEPVKDSLEFMLNENHIQHKIHFAPFNQIFQEILAPSSSFRSNLQGANVIVFRTEDFIDGDNLTDTVQPQLEENLIELQSILKNASEFQVPVITVICPPSRKISENKPFLDFITRIENTFAASLKNVSNLFVFSYNDILENYQISDYDNPKANLYGRIPYTQAFFAGLGAFLARKLYVLFSPPRKVIVLDCDQTLWKGVVGEDGIEGIKFDQAQIFLQEFMVCQSDAGMLICLCSKNDKADVWEVFDTRSEMRLKREHIVAAEINWNFKSENLKKLSEQLQLSLNSFIFVDDDAAVCAEVEANCPEVLTLRLPSNDEEIPSFLKHVWTFDKLKATVEDKLRTKSYQQQIERAKFQEKSGDFHDFLANLQLKCDIAKAHESQIPRISQLSLRTNQFNSTTQRLSENDVKQIFDQKDSFIWTINVSDRFGDYGLVGVMIGMLENEELKINSFMLSCRALGRGIEHQMLAAAGHVSLDAHCKFVSLEFIRSEKNAPVFNFFEDVGSGFKVESAEKSIYKLPAEIAAKIEFNPNLTTKVIERVENKTVKIEAKGFSNFIEKNAAIVKCANELKTAENILAAIKAAGKDRALKGNELIEPRNETERILAEIWQKILNLSEIGIRDDFFKLGGDSLQAVSLFVEIEEKFGKHLPMTILINSPNIEKMAQLIDEKCSTEKLKYLVQLKTGGTQTPLFCMHAAGGNVLFYRDLANELGSDQPIYGLQARGVADKLETAHESVSEMATEYLKEMRAVQPVGPYKLCGSSFGGLIAFEMACQLVAEGEKVSLLALFDTYAPGYPTKKPDSFPLESKFAVLFERFYRVREQLSLIETSRGKLEFINKQFQKYRLRAKRKKVWEKNQFDIAYAKATGGELPVNIQRNHQAIQKALDTYDPPVFDGQMILFRAALQPSGVIFDPTLGWGRFTTNEIIIREVAGSHGALTVYPYAKQLATELSPFLKNQQTASNAAKFVTA